jgi:hypothetical protein
MCRSLLALALAYDAVTYVLELPDGLLQAVISSSNHLQGLAGAVGVRLQLMCCFSAANTQVGSQWCCTTCAGGKARASSHTHSCWLCRRMWL